MHLPVVWITSAIFTLTYIGLAIGKFPGLRMDRAAIAFTGATLMLVFGVLTLQEAIKPDSIDYETLFLLFGMMVVVGYLRISGFFVRLTNWSLSRIRTPHGLLAATILLSGVLSAFLVNDVVCVAITPLVLHLARKLKFNPLPHVIGLATAANIGSSGTITGNPQNMIIGIQSHIPYLHFALHLLPTAAIGLIVDFIVIGWIYRRELAMINLSNGLPVHLGHAHIDEVPNRPIHRWLQRKGVTVALITVILFFCGLPIALVAIAAAAVLLVDRIKPDKLYRQVDWSLLVMFIGLFIVVHAFQMHVVNRWGVEHWNWLLNRPIDLLSLASAALSNLVSNVPAVLLFEPILRAMPLHHQQSAWLALAMSSTFAGNLTILGSVANLIVIEIARREGVAVSFWEYSKVGIPVTLLTLGIGIAWLMLVHY